MRFSKYLIFLFFLLPIILWSQNIAVQSFKSDPSDMTARITGAVKDQNGDKCALIKVRTTQTNFVFEGDMLGITKTIQKVGEIWVYVPSRARKITIKHAQLGILDKYYYTEQIKEATVYIMQLTTGRVTTIVEDYEIPMQWLVIESVPSGAAIYLNDEIQTTLTPFSKKVNIGSYTYRLDYANYHPAAGVIEITSEEKKEMHIELKVAFGQLKVNTSPEEGAAVMLDGKPTGKKTPCVFDNISSGTHRLQLIQDMFEVSNQNVEIKDGETSDLQVLMNPDFSNITIISQAESEIYIDGDFYGKGTWSGRLKSGKHKIETRQKGFNSGIRTLNVVPGEPQEIKLQANAKTGQVDILSHPLGALIFIDDEEHGNTPNTVRNLLTGNHKLELRKSGYGTITKTITITENKPLEVNETLPSGKEITIYSQPPGAEVSLNGNVIGITPLTSTIAFGSHQIKVKNGKKEITEEISISGKGSSSFRYEVQEIENFSEIINGVQFELIAVEGGHFKMGSYETDKEVPVHQVSLNNYYIGKYEVTQAQWKAVMGSNPSHFKGENLPVEKVSWNHIQKFIKKLNEISGRNYRLPTEAEWEYAARGGDLRNSTTYSGSNQIDEVGWYSTNSFDKGEQHKDYGTHKVGSKSPNELGIYDMSGNVWEWCNDWYGLYTKKTPQKNPKGPAKGTSKVYRGGSWYSFDKYCRVATRGKNNSFNSNNHLGFRLAFGKLIPTGNQSQQTITTTASTIALNKNNDVNPTPVEKTNETKAEEIKKDVYTEQNKVYTIVETMPIFTGGESKMYSFIGKNISYPNAAREMGISGRVFISFVIETDGKITNIKILRGIGGGCDEEAMRVIKSMPNWTPGYNDGIPVRVLYRMPIKFTLSNK